MGCCGKAGPLSALRRTAWKKLDKDKTNKNYDNPYKHKVGNHWEKRPLPTHITETDAKILKKVRRKAYRWDMCFGLCCCSSIRFGWGAVWGLLPVVGDFVDFLMALVIIRLACKLDGGLPKRMIAWMLANVLFDFLVGLVPILGDLLDMCWRANTRNAWLLDAYLFAKSDAIEREFISDPDTGEKIALPESMLGDLADRDLEIGGGHEQGVVEQPPAAHPVMSQMRQTPAPVGKMGPPQRPMTPQRPLTPGRSLTPRTPGQQPKDPRDRRAPPRR